MSGVGKLFFEGGQTPVVAGERTEVHVVIQTGDTPVASSDIWIAYPPALLEPILPLSAQDLAESQFRQVGAKVTEPGKLYLFALEPKQTVHGADGLVASIPFRAIRSGQAQLSFYCLDGSDRTTAIIQNDPSLANIFSCEQGMRQTKTIIITGENASVLGATTQSHTAPVWGYLIAAVILLSVSIVLLKNVLKKYLSRHSLSTH